MHVVWRYCYPNLRNSLSIQIISKGGGTYVCVLQYFSPNSGNYELLHERTADWTYPKNPIKNTSKNAIFSACGGLNVLQTIPKMHFFVRVIRENILWCISFPFWSSVYQKSVIQREVFVWIVPKYFSFNERKKDELVISKLRGKKTTQFIFCDWPIEIPMTVTRKYMN